MSVLFPAHLAFFTPEALGFYLPPLMMWAVLALPPFLLLRWAMGRAGFYRLVWHRPLFDAALYIIVLGAVMLGLAMLGPATSGIATSGIATSGLATLDPGRPGLPLVGEGQA
ncbi:hypothetical protein FHS55_001516 [Angulomicrobium tetraedrale]|uniref:DUF1656 domain-containing protein n=1 Tax=Ancylobacter tetraedralis TaxID=217068 RepID=A0A839Z786_9HYPH|nr:hypothetical protein [Ancylobacter tetraedralis]